MTAQGDVHIKLPMEPLDREGPLRNKLRKAMYGTRDAAQRRQKKCSVMARELCVETDKVST